MVFFDRVILCGDFILFLNLAIFQFKSVYREYNQSVEPYNFLAVNVLSKLERLGKSVLSEPSISFDDVRIYVPEQKLALLADDLPYSRKNWVDGYVVDQTDLERVKIRIRGDNPNNWLHDKKSWRLKRPKEVLKIRLERSITCCQKIHHYSIHILATSLRTEWD